MKIIYNDILKKIEIWQFKGRGPHDFDDVDEYEADWYEVNYQDYPESHWMDFPWKGD